jgi:hypothetical protein
VKLSLKHNPAGVKAEIRGSIGALDFRARRSILYRATLPERKRYPLQNFIYASTRAGVFASAAFCKSFDQSSRWWFAAIDAAGNFNSSHVWKRIPKCVRWTGRHD